MDSASQQPKEGDSRVEEKPTAANPSDAATSQGEELAAKRSRSARAGTKRRLDSAARGQQCIRYDRDALLQLRDSRLSSAWPRALDRTFIGDGGLWDPVKLFEGERRGTIDTRPRIERNRNAKANQSFAAAAAAADDGSSYGRSSRRRKRNKDEAPGAQRRQPGCQQSRSKSESEKENKKEKQQRPEKSPLDADAESAVAKPKAAAASGGQGRRCGGQWERSQRPREPLPAWFDEGPTDKMEKLELTGMPEEPEEQKPEASATKASSCGDAAAPGGGSRMANWLPAEPTAAQLERRLCEDLKICQQPQQPTARHQPPPRRQQQQPQQQQQQQKSASRMRTLQEIESSLGAAASDSGDPVGGDSRAIYKLIGELQMQMRDQSRVSRPPASAPPAAAQPTATAATLPQAAAAAAATLGAGLHRPPPPLQQHQHLQQQHQHLQQQQQQTFPADSLPSAAAQRRFPTPLQPQQLQQLQAMLLSNLQLQAQMLHSGQLAGGAPGARKVQHPLNKLLPQPCFYSSPKPLLLPSNALHRNRILNQQFNNGAEPTDFGQSFDSSRQLSDALLGKQQMAAGVSADGSAGQGPSLASVGGRGSGLAQPAMPIVPPMLAPGSSGGAGGFRGSAAQAAWNGAHSQQINAMLWNATKLAASVKSNNSAWGNFPLGSDEQQGACGPASVASAASDEVGTA